MKEEIRRFYIAVIIGIACVPVFFLVLIPLLLSLSALPGDILAKILLIPFFPFFFLSFGIPDYLLSITGFYISPFITLGVCATLLVYIYMWVSERKKIL